MANVTFDPAAFKARFPEFATQTDPVLTAQWNTAALYVTTENYGRLMDDGRVYAVQLMTAHLLRLAANIAADAGGAGTPSIVAQASIDKVRITLAPPPTPDARTYWLNLTPYGQQLIVFLQARAVGGFYVGGTRERAAFRKAGGVF